MRRQATLILAGVAVALIGAMALAAERIPAKVLFGKVKGPALASRPIGSYAKGCLAGGVALPVNGGAWQVMRLSRNRNWGTPQLVDFVETLATDAQKKDGWPGLLVGDMAQPRGGPMSSGHASHQIGLDADIWLTPLPHRTLSDKEREDMSAVTMVNKEKREIDFEGVYLVSPAGLVTLATRDVQKPNGILVSPDGKTVYVADTNSDPKGNHHLDAFRVQADGTLADKRVLYDFGPNRRPIDGMAMDAAGNIYATGGSGERAGLYVFGPAGENLAFVKMPGDPTNAAFGGPSEPTTLYLTGQGPEVSGKPRKYALFRIKLAQKGRP